MAYQLDLLQDGISQRQHELHNIASILAKRATELSRSAASAKVLTIVLGAIAATQAVVTRLVGETNTLTIVFYTVVGLVIATVAGIEAAFKLESRGAELTLLAAECQSIVWQIDSAWQKTVGTTDGEEQVQSARVLLDKQDGSLAEIQKRAAQLGVNITLEVRDLYRGQPPALA